MPTRLDSAGIDWDHDEEAVADVCVRRAEELIPDLRQHAVVRRVYTPRDVARRTPGGPAMDALTLTPTEQRTLDTMAAVVPECNRHDVAGILAHYGSLLGVPAERSAAAHPGASFVRMQDGRSPRFGR